MVDIVEGFEDMELYDNRDFEIKVNTLLSLAKKHDIHIFVETGTYSGEMIQRMNAGHDFDRIYSIELGERLAARAEKLFQEVSNVIIMRGSSDVRLKDIPLFEPALFWLDAHACGGVTARGRKITPIMEELNIVVNEYDHIIVIDDLDNFPNWGISLKNIKDFIESRKRVKFTKIFTMLIVEPE